MACRSSSVRYLVGPVLSTRSTDGANSDLELHATGLLWIAVACGVEYTLVTTADRIIAYITSLHLRTPETKLREFEHAKRAF